MSLTQDLNTHSQEGNLVVLAMAAGSDIYGGALVAVNAAGFATQGVTATGLTYVGRAEEAVDNSAGTDADTTVSVLRKKAFKWKNEATDLIGQSSLFKTCYIVDDETVAATDGAGTRSAAGTVIAIDSDGVWVE